MGMETNVIDGDTLELSDNRNCTKNVWSIASLVVAGSQRPVNGDRNKLYHRE